jgi:hypothetical protein
MDSETNYILNEHVECILNNPKPYIPVLFDFLRSGELKYQLCALYTIGRMGNQKLEWVVDQKKKSWFFMDELLDMLESSDIQLLKVILDTISEGHMDCWQRDDGYKRYQPIVVEKLLELVRG